MCMPAGRPPVPAACNTLEQYVREYVLFLDTSSLLYPKAQLFLDQLCPLLLRYGKKAVVPLRVVQELEKHQRAPSQELARLARRALVSLRDMLDQKVIQIKGEKGDRFADNVFQVVFTKFRMENKLLLVTQDNDLARDILRLNENQAVWGKPVMAKRLDMHGCLSDYGWQEPRAAPRRPLPARPVCPVSGSGQLKLDRPLPTSAVPGAGEWVQTYTMDGQWKGIRLGEEQAQGGEGHIYCVDAGDYVAKIYRREQRTRHKEEKIRWMMKQGVQYPGICFPVAALYNGERQFVGYLMPRASGRELQRSLFIKPLLLRYFPDWKKEDTVQLCVTILEKICYLHRRGILIGDLNPGNILVVSPTQVYFVDTDSYQIDGMPCPVGTVNFTPPEIQGTEYAKFLRTPGHENFAIATLLFMIMLPGKAPYAQQGGQDPIENIRGMNFAYPLGELGSRQTPDGPWRFIWSHLTYEIKSAFYHTFQKDGCYSAEKDRLDAEEWLELFRRYLHLLKNGTLRRQDPMSEELFPTRYKLNPNVDYVTCKLCGQPTPEKNCREGICRTCLDDGEVRVCRRCGKEFLYTNYQKYVKKQQKCDLCKACKTWWNEPALTVSCQDCGNSFVITNGEKHFFTERGLSLPKRCRSCRRKGWAEEAGDL